jgi:hypothetical protein
MLLAVLAVVVDVEVDTGPSVVEHADIVPVVVAAKKFDAHAFGEV